MSQAERNNILDQHKHVYDGFVTTYGQQINQQPIYVQDLANDKGGLVVNNKGVVKPYTNININESDAFTGAKYLPDESFDFGEPDEMYEGDYMETEMSEKDDVHSKVTSMMDEIFSESKVDKVLTSYFQVTESEKKEKKQKLTESKKVAVSSIKRMSETIEQELAAEFIVRENSNYKLVGKTNKSNLVFEHNGEQIRVTPKGEVL
jgi:hypothetical protein